MRKIALVVPTLNPGDFWKSWLEAFSRQLEKPDYLLIIDSSSTDGMVDLAKSYDFEIRVIPKADFGHGRTRQWAVELLPHVDIIVFMTQDAVFSEPQSLQYLLGAFSNPKVGAVYGRQLPNSDARHIGAHARLFNYSAESSLKFASDIPEFGIKTAFFSNSFAAYRRSALLEAGGFPVDGIFGEDVSVTAKMLLNGWGLQYCAEATVYHSHDYTVMEDFKRYFDIGVFHCQQSWILESLGAVEGEGKRFVLSEIQYVFKRNPLLVLGVGLRTLLKYLGYRLGRLEHILPVWVKRRISMHSYYWRS